MMLVMVFMNSRNVKRDTKILSYSELLEMVEKDEIAQISIRGDTLVGLKRESAVPSTLFPDRYDFQSTIGDDFLLSARQIAAQKSGKPVDLVSVGDLPYKVSFKENNGLNWMTFLPIILEVIFIGVFIYFMFSSRKGKGNPFGFGKMTNVQVVDGRKNHITFKDVAGAQEEKEELQEMVDFLRSPKTYTQVGARIPKGVLLIGPPGTGKTLLAKAVAGEAHVPFFSISGSDFVEMYVGVGASRVRDLFDQAKHNAPSIIFIDEIDAVGRRRGAGLGGGHDEREQTLNQLLVEMDGFTFNEGVIVMAATNRKDILDPALLRPGRFDRQVTVNYPDQAGRVEILKIHARGKPLAKDVDLDNLAKRMPFSAGADLENVMNEAAILTARARRTEIDQQTLIDAIARVQMGPEKRSHKVSEKDKRMVAVHESGHAVIGHILPGCDEVHLVTIVPRGMSAGHTLSLPEEEHDNMSRSRMLDQVTMALGGLAAEQVILGEVYTGSSSDLKSATDMCRQMVTRYGMSDTMGPIYLGSDQEVFVGMEFGHSREYSEEIAAHIDQEVRTMLTGCFEKAKKLISDNQECIEILVTALLKEETIGRKTFVAIMDGRDYNEETDEDLPRPAEPIPEVKPEEAVKSVDRPELPSSFIPEEKE